MHVAGNSSTEAVAKRILASLKAEGTATLDAIGDRALAKATQAVEQAQEWRKTTYPCEHNRHKAEIEGKEKTVHRIVVYR